MHTIALGVLGRRRTALGLLGIGLLVALASPAPAQDRPTVAILPFRVHSAKPIEYLGESLANLLRTRLEASGQVQVLDPRGMVEVVPAEGSVGGRALSAGCHFIAYAFLDQSASAGPTGLSPVSIRHSYACIDGVEDATACNATTGEHCDAVQITIREPVPNFAHLLVYNANPIPGAPPATQEPNGSPIHAASVMLFVARRTL